MPRYVDADYLLKELSFYADRPTKSAMKMIKDIALHPADVIERKKGKWVKLYADSFHCRLCGHTFMVIQGGSFMNYCPSCGADMREEKTDAEIH